MEVLLDGSFMIHAIKNKIDFLDQLAELGFTPKIPREVIQELKDLHEKARFENRVALGQLLELIEKRKVKKVGFGPGKVDENLIKFGKQGIYVATTDSGIRRLVPNKIILSVASKKISVERS
jgi:rRNA-processing protein FCF1